MIKPVFAVEGFDFFTETSAVSKLTPFLFSFFQLMYGSAYASVDVSLKKLVPILVSISTGNLEIEGWSQDRIRVLVEPKIPVVDNPDTWVKINETPSRLTVTINPWSKLTMAERLKAQQSGEKVADVKIFVPWASHIDFNALKGDVKVDTFRGEGMIRAKGRILVGELRSRHGGVTLIGDSGVSIGQGSGKVAIRSNVGDVNLTRLSEAQVTIQTQDSKVTLINAENSDLSVESARGPISVENGSGKVFVQGGSGSLSVVRFRGSVDLETISGPIALRGLVARDAESSVRSQSGLIQFQPVLPWNLSQIEAKNCQVKSVNHEGWTLQPRVSPAVAEWVPCDGAPCLGDVSAGLRLRCGP